MTLCVAGCGIIVRIDTTQWGIDVQSKGARKGLPKRARLILALLNFHQSAKIKLPASPAFPPAGGAGGSAGG